jgi:hypothetical protein
MFAVVPREDMIRIHVMKLKNMRGFFDNTRPDRVYVMQPEREKEFKDYIGIIVHLLYYQNKQRKTPQEYKKWTYSFLLGGIEKWALHKFLEQFKLGYDVSYSGHFYIAHQIAYIQNNVQVCFLQFTRVRMMSPRFKEYVLYDLGRMFYAYIIDQFDQPMQKRFGVGDPFLIVQEMFKVKDGDVWSALSKYSKEILLKTE